MSAVSYRIRGYNRPSRRVIDLPANHLACLVAFAACWSTIDSAPTERQLAVMTRLSRSLQRSAIRALIHRGLLGAPLNHGNGRRMRPQLTAEAWEQLSALVDREVA